MTAADWHMTSEDPSTATIAGSNVWHARIRSAGALRNAPRDLECWFANEDVAVYDLSKALLWLNVGDSIAYRNADGSVSEFRDSDDGELFTHPAPEAVALTSRLATLAWLGVREPYQATEQDITFLNRRAVRLSLAGGDFDSIQLVTDQESGVTLKISADHPIHGPSEVEVTSFEHSESGMPTRPSS